MIELVCSECGGHNLSHYEQRGIDNWPMAKCRDHGKSGKIVALMSERAWQHKKKRRHEDKPIDLFASLPEDEQAALRRPVR